MKIAACRGSPPCPDMEAATRNVGGLVVTRRTDRTWSGTGSDVAAGTTLIEVGRFSPAARARAMAGRACVARTRAGRTCRRSATFSLLRSTRSVKRAREANSSCRQQSLGNHMIYKPSFSSQSRCERPIMKCKHSQQKRLFSELENLPWTIRDEFSDSFHYPPPHFWTLIIPIYSNLFHKKTEKLKFLFFVMDRHKRFQVSKSEDTNRHPTPFSKMCKTSMMLIQLGFPWAPHLG